MHETSLNLERQEDVRRKLALNSKTACITDIEVLDGLKAQELELAEAEPVKT